MWRLRAKTFKHQSTMMSDHFKKKYLIYFTLVALFVLVRVFLANEPMNSDDLTLFIHSKALTTGEHDIFRDTLPQEVSHQSLRFGLEIPEAFLIKIVGPNFIAYYLLPLTFSLAGFLLIIKFSKEFLPFAVMIMGALIHIVLPFEIRHSSLLLTDLPAALFLVAYIYYIDKYGLDKFDVKKLLLHSFIASFLIFWGYLLRENQFILSLPAVTVFLFYRRCRWIALGSLAFFFLWLIGEQLFYVSKGVQFGYRWAIVKAALDNYSKFLPNYRFNEFVMRSFKFILKDIGFVGLLFYVSSLIFHFYGLFVSKKPLIKAILFSGLSAFTIFNFSIYQITDGVIKTMAPLNHRYMQMFYYSSLVAIPFGLHNIFTLAKKKLSSFTNDRGLAPFPRYLGSSVIILLFLYVLIVFWQVNYKYPRRLLNPGSKYWSLLSAINNEMTRSKKEKIEIFGTERSLRAVSLFHFASRKHLIYWHSITYEDLKSKLEKQQADYFLTDHRRETVDLRYLKGQKQKDQKAMLDNISRITINNYYPIYISNDFRFYKSRDVGMSRAFPELFRFIGIDLKNKIDKETGKPYLTNDYDLKVCKLELVPLRKKQRILTNPHCISEYFTMQFTVVLEKKS